jgi:copper chaperone CopZ
MHCNGCVRSVTNALKRIAGVLSAEVSLQENSAKVEFDEKETSPDVLRKAIQDIGYDVKE